jgi:hypothetical protein
MKKKLFIVLITALSFSAIAQISITSSNMPVSGDTIRYTNANLNSIGDYTTTGTNYNWLFDTLRPTSQAIREFKSGLSTPYSIMFGMNAYGEKILDTVPIPNIPITGIPSISITDLYNFYKKTSTVFEVEGLGLKLSGIPVPNYYTDKDELYFFPLDYLDRDSSTFRFSTISNTLIPFQYIKQGHRITESDGWGSITTPYGTANCLRVVTTQYSIDTIKGTVTLPVVGTQPFAFGFKNYQRSYQWLTLGERIPYFEVSGTLTGTTFNPTQARYRNHKIDFVGLEEATITLALSVFPNPSSNTINIVLPKNKTAIKAEIVDLQGKTVLSNDLINNSEIVNQHQLDVSSLAKGLYILNLSNLEGKQSIKISLQ